MLLYMPSDASVCGLAYSDMATAVQHCVASACLALCGALFVVLHLNVALCVAQFDNVLQCGSVCMTPSLRYGASTPASLR